MNGISMRSFLAGAVLASSLTLGGMVLAHGEGDGEGMMGGSGMMGMMSQMQAMMSRCNAMMDKMEGRMDGGGMRRPEAKPDSSS